MTSTFTQRGGSDATATRPETLTTSEKPQFDVVTLFKENPSRGGDLKGNASVDHAIDFGSSMKLYGGEIHPVQISELPKFTTIIKDNPSVPVQLVEAASEIRHAQDALASGNPARAAQWMQEALKHLQDMRNGEKQPSFGGVDRTPSIGEQPHSGKPGNACGDGKSETPGATTDAKQPDPLQELQDTLTDAVRALGRGNMKQVQALLSSLVSQVDALTGNDQPGIHPLVSGHDRPYWGIYGSPENPALPIVILPEDLAGIGLKNPDISGTGGFNRPIDPDLSGITDGPAFPSPRWPNKPDFSGITDGPGVPFPKIIELPKLPRLRDITREPKLPAFGEGPAFSLPEIEFL